jgi:uncharacterized lipoprotein YddW (UPF0748 family)
MMWKTACVLAGACLSSLLLLCCGLAEKLPQVKEEISTAQIDHINPTDKTFPGGRGQDQLVLYTPAFGQRTDTNEWGAEAVVVEGIVTRAGDNNSSIPRNGFVISGHGKAKRWILENLAPGTEVSVEDKTVVAKIGLRTYLVRAGDYLGKAEDSLKRRSEAQRAVPYELIEQEVGLGRAALTKAESLQSAGRRERALAYAFSAYQHALRAYYGTFESREREARSVWYRITDRSPEGLAQTLDRLKAANFNMIFPETIYEGGVLYAPPQGSMFQQASAFKGWDPLRVMLVEGHKRGIEVHAWVHVFFVGFADSPLVKAHPEWLAQNRTGGYASSLEKGYYFFCPGNEEARRALLREYLWLVQSYDLDGFQLDYIRYPSSDPYSEGYCYCNNCRKRFFDLFGKDLAEFDPEKNPEVWQKWSEMQEENVTSFVREVRSRFKEIRPELKLSADIFGDLSSARKSKFQNWALWSQEGLIDFLCPMAYSSDTRYVKNETIAVREILGKTPVVVGIAPYLGLPAARIVEQVEAVREGGGNGVSLFSLKSLNAEKMQALELGPFREAARPW